MLGRVYVSDAGSFWFQRESEIDAFKPEPFFSRSNLSGGGFGCRFLKSTRKKAKADSVAAACKGHPVHSQKAWSARKKSEKGSGTL
jgi:hypothetical protein